MDKKNERLERNCGGGLFGLVDAATAAAAADENRPIAAAAAGEEFPSVLVTGFHLVEKRLETESDCIGISKFDNMFW